jgi:hypothetical protein
MASPGRGGRALRAARANSGYVAWLSALAADLGVADAGHYGLYRIAGFAVADDLPEAAPGGTDDRHAACLGFGLGQPNVLAVVDPRLTSTAAAAYMAARSSPYSTPVQVMASAWIGRRLTT